MRFSSLLALAPLLGMSWAAPVDELAVRQDSDLPRLIIYYQTIHDSNGNPISILPLIDEQGIALTHLIVCSLHINQGSEMTLNDKPPSDASFQTLWNETKVLQDAGVRVMGMIGGAAKGSWDTDTLDGDDATFEQYYGQLHDVITTYSLQGMDLDVEQSMSQSGITRLVNRLKTDFGGDFMVTLAPVGTDMSQGYGLSGFSYAQLEADAGANIAFYNVQYYNGWGDLSTPADYEAGVNAGFSADRLVAGQVTAPSNGGGYVDFPTLGDTISTLRTEYGQIGGVMGWEYFNGEPGGTSAPWEWAQQITEILRPGLAPKLKITKADAERLTSAYEKSGRASADVNADSMIKTAPKVDYMAMVNA